MSRSTFVYVTYIRTTPERLWAELTDAEKFREFWFGMRIESTFKKGDPWKMTSTDGVLYDAGEITESVPNKRLVMNWEHQLKPELKSKRPTICTIDLEPTGSAVKLTITHSMDPEAAKFLEAVSIGWPKVASNLKSLLETGTVALQELRY